MNNTEIDYPKYLNAVVPMVDLVEYSDNCSKKFQSLCRYYIHEPNATFTNSESFKCKVKIKGRTPAGDDTKDVKIALPLTV